MDDVTQLVDAIREQVLARMRELREGTSGPRWTGTVAAARDELLRRLEDRIRSSPAGAEHTTERN
jgi:hypothetical protein